MKTKTTLATIIVIGLGLMSFNVTNAQITVGGGIAYGPENALGGVNLRVGRMLTEKLTLVGAFDYMLTGEEITVTEGVIEDAHGWDILISGYYSLITFGNITLSGGAYAGVGTYEYGAVAEEEVLFGFDIAVAAAYQLRKWLIFLDLRTPILSDLNVSKEIPNWADIVVGVSFQLGD